MGETRVVKRYANRKLYDTQRSRYVTLEQIGEMIRAGEDVQIVDNNSKEDLTSVTLTQIIFEEQKQKSMLPLSALRNIIQSTGQSFQNLPSQAGEKVRSVFRRGGDGGGEAPPEPEPEPSSGPIREFFERSQDAFEEWQKRVDERIRQTVDSLSPLAPLEKEI